MRESTIVISAGLFIFCAFMFLMGYTEHRRIKHIESMAEMGYTQTYVLGSEKPIWVKETWDE
jgi:hypothetical protein